MIKIQDWRDVLDALEKINEFLENSGSMLFATILSHESAKDLNELCRLAGAVGIAPFQSV